MPATSEKQKKFFGTVMGAKRGQKGSSPQAKKVAKEMPEKEIKHFLKKEDEETPKNNEEDAESVASQVKKTGKAVFEGPKVKDRKKFAPATKVETPKKGAAYNRAKEKRGEFGENTDIINFIECIMAKKYASANKYLNRAVEFKLQQKIEQELETPLF